MRRYPTISADREHGAALIVTLLIIVLFVVVVTGFLSTTRVEQMAARNFSFQTAARQMADLGLEQALAQMNAAVAAGATNVVTQPGRMVVDGATNFLSSASQTNALATNVYLNKGEVIHTNTDTNLFQLPLVPVTNTNGILLGRYAYWVDDEGTKANLNAMLGASRTNFVPRIPRYFDYRAVGTAGATDFETVISGSSTAATEPWSYFFTGKQIGLLSGVGTSLATRYLHSMAAGPGNMNPLPAWAANRRAELNGEFITEQPITNSGSEWWRNFLTNASGTTALDDEVDDVISLVDRPAITNLFGSSFSAKYGRDALRQIVVNINDWPVSAGTLSTNVGGVPGGRTALSGAAMLDAEGIPTTFLGLRRFPHLNEIAVRVGYATNSLSRGRKLEFQTWFQIELVNPYGVPWGDGAQIVIKLKNVAFDIAYQTNGVDGITTIDSRSIIGGDWNWNGNSPASDLTNAIVIPRSNNVPPAVFSTGTTNASLSPANGVRFSYAFEWSVWGGDSVGNIPNDASNLVVTNVRISPSSVRLLQWSNAPLTIRDWAIESDFGVLEFPNATLVPSELPNGAGPQSPPAGIDNFNAADARGIAKNDPRVRRFPAVTPPLPAWYPVGGANPAVTIGANNSVVNFSSGTGLPNSSVRNDPAVAGGDIFSHPSFQGAFVALNTNEPYRTVTELGRVHTGLQWRTLQIRYQDSAERTAGLIPDWALLETFYTTNVPTKLNVNSLQQPATTNDMPAPSVQRTAGLTRPLAVKALLTGGTAANASDDGFDGASGMNNSTMNIVSTNIASMALRPGWSSQRATNPAFVTNAYTLVGEVLEVSNVSDFNTTDDFISEGRAAAFIDAMSVSSDTFAIYSVGQALDPAGRQVAEYRARTQVRRNPATGRFEAILTEPLLAP